jgi:hypothetical protein
MDTKIITAPLYRFGAVILMTVLGFAPPLFAQEADPSAAPESALDPAASPQEAPAAENRGNILDAEARGHRGLSFRGPGGNIIHIRPPRASIALRAAGVASAPATTPVFSYNGGPVMTTANIYTIFWIPSALQNGAKTKMSKAYINLQNKFAGDYPGHGIDNNNTQYYQVANGVTTYIHNTGKLAGKGGTFTDTSPYPASGCTDSATPGNCITDTQLQAEIANVIASQGWPNGGLTNIYLVFTSSNEGSCFSDGGYTFCAYIDYCAYHSYAGTEAAPIIYANLPYGTTSICQDPDTPSPNNNPDADTSTTNAVHELTESITDPEGTAWYDQLGYEIADDCYDGVAADDYGTNSWDNGLANEMWNGHFYELQGIWDLHTNQCVWLGP